MRISLCLLLWICLFVGSYGQSYVPGYYVMNHGDTVRCLINESIKHNAIEVRNAEGERTISLGPSEIASFSLGREGVVYESHWVNIDIKPVETSKLDVDDRRPRWDRQRLFLNLINKGPANLYGVQDGTGKQHFFLKVEADNEPQELLFIRFYYSAGGAAVELPNFREQLTKALAGCPGNYRNTPYNEPSLSKIVRAYNICKGYHGTDVIAQKKVLISPYVQVGIISGKSSFSGYPGAAFTYQNNIQYGSSSSPLFIVGAEIGSRREKSRLSLPVELGWRKFSYSIDVSDFSYNLTSFHVMPRYTLPGKVRPFVQLGAIVALYSGGKNRYYWNYSNRVLAPFSKMSTGYLVSLGITSDRLGIELRYDQHVLFAPELKARWTNIGISAMVSYRLRK